MGPVIPWLLALAAAAEPDPEASWSPARVVGTLDHDGRAWTVVHAPADRELRARCRGDAPPERVALEVARGALAVVVPPLAPPVAQAGWWVLPPPGAGGAWWALGDGPCRVQARDVGLPPADLDRIEQRAGDPDAALVALRDAGALAHRPDHAIALALADDPWSAWLALRPPSPLVPVTRPLRPDAGRRARIRPAPHDPPAAWQVPAGASWAVRGPAQVRLDARPLGPPGVACLAVHGPHGVTAPSCQRSSPLEVPDLAAGAARVPEVDGAPVGRGVAWHVWVPPGPHTLVLDRPALAHGRALDPDALLALGPGPDAVQVHALGEAWTESSARLVAAPAPPARADHLLFTPARWSVAEPDGVAWVAPEDLDGHARWWTGDGRVPLLVDADPDRPCRVVLPGGGAFVTVAGDRVQWFLPPPGAVLDPADPPRFEGCRGRLRAEGLTVAPRDRLVAVGTTRLAPGHPLALRWPAPHAGPVRLQLHAEAGVEVVTVRVRAGDGPLRAWTVHLRPPPRPALDAEGRRWSAPVELRLDAPGEDLVVEADAPLAVRALATPALGVLPPALPAPDAAGVPDPRAASAAVAAAPDDRARALALLDRAGALAAAGALRDALDDLALAEALGVDVDTRPLRAAMLAEGASQWAPATGWVPLGSAWIPDLPDLGRDGVVRLARQAAEGHADRVALALRERASPVPWWVEAARTQTLTPGDAQRAAVDLARWGVQDPEHPAFAAVRSWSAWRLATAVRGTEGFRAAWPAEGDDDPDGRLFPDLWPEAARVPLGPGWTLALPPLPHPVDVEVRCAARDEQAAASGCRLRHLAVDGSALAAADVPPWGAAIPLRLPASAGPTFLDLESPGVARAEVRLPPALAATGLALREARRMTGPEASLHVLGPTVVRVDAWRPGGPARLRAAAGDDAVEVDLGPAPTSAWLPVAGEEVREVRIQAPPGTLLRVLVRGPDERRTEPPDHAPLLAALRRPPPSSAAGPALVAPPPVAPPPREGPRVTLLAEARVGVGGDVDEDPEATVPVPIRGAQRVGVASRPTAAPFWVEGSLAAWEAAGLAAVGEARVVAEGWWSGAPVDGWLLGDAVYRASLEDLPLHTLRARLDGGLAIRPRRWLDLRLGAEAGAAVRSGAYVAGDRLPSLLWSAYRDAHRLWLEPAAEVRAHPTPWARTRAWVRVLTNPPGDAVVHDAVTAGLDVRFAAPFLSGEVGVGLQHRPVDLDRRVAYTTPLVHGSLRGALWVRRGLALALRADAGWQPRFQRLTFDLAAEVLWSGRRGLPDVRPSRMDARHALTWVEP